MTSSNIEGRAAAPVRPLFPLDRIVGTPAALEALKRAGVDPMALLTRHVTGDWGELHSEDATQNEIGVFAGRRILSSYAISTARSPLECSPLIRIITEADRSVTTFLLPEDY